MASILIVSLSFFVKNYKIVLVLILLMSLFPVFDLGNAIFSNVGNTTNWANQPDNIQAAKFKQSPNVYFIQVDGYANAEMLRSKLYDFDNSEFDHWLKEKKFTLYDGFRSNYSSTIKSNASCFNMKHHYSKENSVSKTGRDYILGKNAVLDVFKNNGYKTFFISERPYLLMNRPSLAYDYSNFSESELPFLKDGWSLFKEIAPELKSQILQNKKSKNFFFVQKLSPTHIAVRADASAGKKGERFAYLNRVKETNLWIKDVVSFIEAKDANAIIILGADHGGFVGFNTTVESFSKVTDSNLLHSIFGAKMAIHWNDPTAAEYGKHLKTSVNLFRIVFAFLSSKPEYLQNLQPDVSYHNYDLEDRSKIQKAIE